MNMTRRRSLKDFQIFLKVLEVYGMGYEDDVDKLRYNLDRANYSH